jgi:hypothetical protein
MASFMMCQSADDLRVQAQWDGARGDSRLHLLSDLSSKWCLIESKFYTNAQQNPSRPVS